MPVKRGDILDNLKGDYYHVYETDNPDLLEVEYINHNSNGTKLTNGRIGVLSNKISIICLETLEQNGVSTHYASRGNTSSSKIVKKCFDKVHLKVIGRFKTNSECSKRYGFEEMVKIFPMGIEFDLKDDSLTRQIVPDWVILRLYRLSPAGLEKAKSNTLLVGKVLSGIFSKFNMELIDFEIEFGLDRYLNLMICSEISLYSCTLLDKETGEKIDASNFINKMDKYLDLLKRM